MKTSIECNNVSIKYVTGDLKAIGLKEYIVRNLVGKYHVEEFWADRNITFKINEGTAPARAPSLRLYPEL